MDHQHDHAPYAGAPRSAGPSSPARPRERGAARPGRRGPRHFGSRPPHPRRPGRTRVEHHPRSGRAPAARISEPDANTVRIIPLGGVEEIGRNMTAVEIGPDIFILDCGFQFREEEFVQGSQLQIREVEMDEAIKLGNATVRFFNVTHTVPDSMGIIIETPWGDVVFTGDIKLDHENGEPSEEEHQEYSIFQKRNVLALLMDSTNVWQPGFSIPESTVYRPPG